MKEHSQIEDMRAALRGDLERARKRGSSPLLQPEPESEPEPEPERVPEEPEPESAGLLSFLRRRA
jgi:hypothetical protein